MPAAGPAMVAHDRARARTAPAPSRHAAGGDAATRPPPGARRGRPLRPRRAQHRLGDDERPHRGASPPRNEGGKTTVFVGAASGGVWKSLDGGTTFKPVFDKQPVQSIGAITIDPTNPKTVWVGTGEAWTRNSVSIGDGIYKSTDGGETWTNMGLPESERIARILVHPKNGDVVYACVPGQALERQRRARRLQDDRRRQDLERWSSKGANLSTGCSGLAMDPKNPDVALRRAVGLPPQGLDVPLRRRRARRAERQRALPHRRRRQDLDASSRRRAQQGLPTKPWGRVEVAVAPVESEGRLRAHRVDASSALYRSDDGGRDLGGARQEPEHGLAPVLLRAA